MTINKVQVRPASEDDLPALADDPDSFGLLVDRLRRRDEGRGELLVACEGVRPIGHLYIWDEQADEHELRDRLPGTPLLMNLWVRADCRRQGIGSRLMTDAEDWLRRRGRSSVALGVDTENKDAIKLYLGLGYYPWAHEDIKTHRDRFHSDGSRFMTWETCAVFIKDLVVGLESASRSRAVGGCS